MTIWQIALCDLARQLSSIRRLGSNCLKALGTGLLLLVMALLNPTSAKADCEVTDTGIPDDAAFKLDPGGIRQGLAREGIGIGGMYLGETFANSGGINQGAKYDGVLWMYLSGDMKKLGLWKGLCFHADAYQIHGQSITADNIGSLMPVSNYEALAATRLSELWFEQHMFDDRLAVRIGQLTADTEFALSIGGAWFLNGTWGWSSLLASDMPSGGPAYPLATPGVRVAITPNDKASLMIGVYNGDPSTNCASDDPQVCNNDGLDFSLDAPPLLMVEGAYKYNQEQACRHDQSSAAGTISVPSPTSASIPAARMIAVTGNPGQAARQRLGPLRHHRSADLARAGKRRPEGCGRVRPLHGRAGRPKPRRLLFRRRHHFYRHDRAQAERWIGDRLRLYRHLRTACTVTTSIWVSRSRATTRR